MECISRLPHKLQEEDNSKQLKKLLKIFCEELENDRINNEHYGNLISLEDISGVELDLYGDMYAVYRKQDESDEDFRKRITVTVILRKSGNSIPAIQEVITQFVPEGDIKIRENNLNRPANVYLIGNTTTDTFSFIFELVKDLVPAGVKLFVPVFMLGTWQDMKNTAELWSDVNTDRYIW